MTNEVVLSTSVRAVSWAIGAVIQTYRATRATNKAEMDRLREALEAARAMEHASHVARLARRNIEELIKTQKLIDASGCSGVALGLLMDNLQLLGDQLTRGSERFARD